jgi:hypothetical protein
MSHDPGTPVLESQERIVNYRADDLFHNKRYDLR